MQRCSCAQTNTGQQAHLIELFLRAGNQLAQLSARFGSVCRLLCILLSSLLRMLCIVVGGMRAILLCLGCARLALLICCLLLTGGAMRVAIALANSAAAGLMRPFPDAAAAVVLAAVMTACVLLIFILTGTAGDVRREHPAAAMVAVCMPQ